MSTTHDGAFFQAGSQCVRFADITDGLTDTLLVGEKHIPLDHLGMGWWDCSTYDGGYLPCSTRAAGPSYPLATSPQQTQWLFGSLHQGVCQFAFCDGRVRSLPVTTDPRVLGLLASRCDGQPLPDY
jgi:prepilin-type processing-associated H-X9-DG protein